MQEAGAGHEQERELVCSPRIILACVWGGPGAFLEEPNNFLGFLGLFDESTL